MPGSASIVHASREHEDVLLGASPRASIALFRTAQALAAVSGRDYALPDDVKPSIPDVPWAETAEARGARAGARRFRQVFPLPRGA